jgi:hypothetical protein
MNATKETKNQRTYRIIYLLYSFSMQRKKEKPAEIADRAQKINMIANIGFSFLVRCLVDVENLIGCSRGSKALFF